MSEDDVLMELLTMAYVRGVDWAKENPGSDEFKYKAAGDYADALIGDARTLAELMSARKASKQAEAGNPSQ